MILNPTNNNGSGVFSDSKTHKQKQNWRAFLLQRRLGETRQQQSATSAVLQLSNGDAVAAREDGDGNPRR